MRNIDISCRHSVGLRTTVATITTGSQVVPSSIIETQGILNFIPLVRRKCAAVYRGMALNQHRL